MREVLLAAGLLSAATAQTPPPQPPPLPSTAYQQAARLPARIVNFAAQPDSIQPGRSATLLWATENPNGVSIEPGVGTVTARGSRQVSPAATTTYTLTARGANNQVVTREVTVTVAGTKPVTNRPAPAAKAEVPRMPDGKPNLSGVYNSAFPGNFFPGGPAMNIAGVARPDETKATLKPGAEKFKVIRGPNDTGLTSDCMPTGVPEAYFMTYQWQIVQSLDRVVILYEYPHLFRVVPPQGGPHQADLDPTWMGDSIGHWEGDTLVVDTIGFNDKTELPGGYRHTEALHIVERFRRATLETLEYQATVDDPNVFAKPWIVSRIFPLRPELEKVDEFVCENNQNYNKFFKKE